MFKAKLCTKQMYDKEKRKRANQYEHKRKNAPSSFINLTYSTKIITFVAS